MNWFSWLLVVAVSYGVQGQTRRGVQRSAVTRRFPRLFCFRNNRIYTAGQQFPSNDGCNTCTCNGYDRVTCTEIGCLTTTPPSVVELCELPSETGQCRAYIPSWYYNKKEGRCIRFVYGGCGGNTNRFSTKAACEQRCGKVVDLCELPSETGRCRAYIPRWYYNKKEGRCIRFVYGGCGGNTNRFRTKAACEQRCGKGSPCKVGQPLPRTPCGGWIDKSCPNNYECLVVQVPGRFDNPGVCCRKAEPVVELCQLPSATGHCKAAIPRWYYNKKEGKCLSFSYGGCGGNANRFTTKAACEQRCGKELCKLPSHTGSCDGFFPSWYHNDSEKRCKQFIYGGCYGNPNRFETQAECQKRCRSEPVCAQGEPLSGRACGGMLPGNDCPSGYTCVGELVPVDGPGVCCPSKPEPVCNYGKPLVRRTCGGRRPRRGPRRRPWRRPRRRQRRRCPRGYECVGDRLAFGGLGVCCPRNPEPVCSQGKPLAGRTCGGRRLGNQCPRGYQCEGKQLAFDGPGVCCPTDTGPSNLVCPPLPTDTYGICVEQCPIEGCPTSQLCCSNGCGNVCKVGVPKTHQLCPRLNPLIRLHCFRFEQCPKRGCPGQQECCPNHCGTGCMALRPPCGIKSPLRDSSGRQMFCGRGRNRVDCPSGHYCSIDPGDRYAVCCPYFYP